MQFNKKAKVEVTGVNFGELVALIQKAQIAVNFTLIFTLTFTGATSC